MKKTLILKGLAVSEGQAQGIAKVVLPNKKNSLFKEGEILVTTITDPTMVSVMVKAAAIICDIGGLTSHPAILSREMGTPCVTNTKSGTKKIKSGMKIFVDGTKGEIYALD